MSGGARSTSALGRDAEYPKSPGASILETFENPQQQFDYSVAFESRELTSLCPITEQPDFYTLKLSYHPADRCLESKSLKLYLFSFRNVGTFIETMANRMFDDFWSTLLPKSMRLRLRQNPRGGIPITVDIERERDDDGVTRVIRNGRVTRTQ